MIIVMKRGASQDEIQGIVKEIEKRGLRPHLSQGVERTVIGAIGDEAAIRGIAFEAMDGVESATPIQKPYKLAGRELHPTDSVVDIAPGITIGGDRVLVMAGPCSVEPNRELMFRMAEGVKKAGAQVFRGGAFKPRTSPYDFQGMGEEGLKILAECRERTGLGIITEVMDTREVELVYKYTDIFQIGARNMQNFNLLKEVGKTDKAVLLKRGLAATLKEWFMCAEYIMANGNHRVILCERGIRSFDQTTRNLFDATAVAIAKAETHLPVVVDPSHAGGSRKWVEPISKAALAIGADGLIVEAHEDPAHALSDGAQTVSLDVLMQLMGNLKPFAQAAGKAI